MTGDVLTPPVRPMAPEGTRVGVDCRLTERVAMVSNGGNSARVEDMGGPKGSMFSSPTDEGGGGVEEEKARWREPEAWGEEEEG